MVRLVLALPLCGIRSGVAPNDKIEMIRKLRHYPALIRSLLLIPLRSPYNKRTMNPAMQAF